MPTLTEATFTAQDEATLRGLFEATVRYIKAGDYASWARLYAEDGFLQPANGRAVQGHQNLVAWARSFPQIEEFAHQNVRVWGEGNLAYGTSGYTMKFKGLPHDLGKQLVVFRRGADGAWKVVAASINSDLPVATVSGTK